MNWTEDQLKAVVAHQLVKAVSEGRARNPVKLGDHIRADMLDAERIYPGTIAAAYNAIKPDEEYIPKSNFTDYPVVDPDGSIAKKAIADFRAKMGWAAPVRRESGRIEPDPPASDVRGFTKPDLRLVTGSLAPCHACGSVDTLDDNDHCSSCAEPERVAKAEPDYIID